MKKLQNKARVYDSPLIKKLLAEITPEQHLRIEKQMLMAVRIADAIEEKGWSKQEFAAKMGQNPSAVSRWLSGTHNFTLTTLTDIQRVLGTQLLCVEEPKIVEKVTKVQFEPFNSNFKNLAV